ncbi:DNA ligase [Herbaspirillum sp. YR522]|uniref:DNA ligase n=1 Tax=Herbaspirillum sp. YR522 TaxID=1144342 RepID=UPI00026FB374|nr:DNA ligase [Herbaspirillum sp. YR522]EJN06163.1 ATP dependent DNA ligase-like protein [Herbaspirillum sp. YR522]
MPVVDRSTVSTPRRRLLLALSATALAWRPGKANAAPPLAPPGAARPVPPPLMLANPMPGHIRLADYWVSEKYDGIRAYWDGQQLFTRGGQVIHAPTWFTRGWPDFALDGELWGGRGRFEQTVSTARREQPQEQRWRALRYMVFDLPRHGQRFDQRLPALIKSVEGLRQPWVQAVRQQRVASPAALQRLLAEVERGGGEGLMLHRGDSLYRAGRSDDLLKFKSMDDAEATVIAHLPGKGKYTGLVGALTVQDADGLRFNLGSGLSDAMRRDPPPIGSLVTYRYRGRHPSGKPRFAVLLRTRVD